ncbi:MAG: phosphopantetheine-binding protein [Campylobacterota bacterium]
MGDLQSELKTLIVTECAKDIDPGSIQNDEPLFENSDLELDSMDSLQVSMAIQRDYGISITDSKSLKKVMYSIETLAEYIADNKQ